MTRSDLYAYVVRPFFLFMALTPFMDALHLSAWNQTGVGIGVVGFLWAADQVAAQRLDRAKVTVDLKSAGVYVSGGTRAAKHLPANPLDGVSRG